MKYCLLLFLTFYSLSYTQTPFSTDSALSYLKTISVDIGPRPMGSLNERRAMEYAMSKLREFGLKVYFMNMDNAENKMTGYSVNTSSGIAVGILQGKTDRIIIIGGHIDSASPFVPGANDNGSGAVTVIELARVLSKEHLQYTIVFCLFGGEESGLCGSNYFVDHFPQIDKADLMLGADMANGNDPLNLLIDYQYGSAPVWLVQAAYDEFNKLGYSGLSYTTHFFTAMSIIPGGIVGSDHESFLSNNVPALTFTSNMNDPIHTPQDDFEHFKPNGLKRSGDLIYALVHKFDKNIPEEKTNRYYLLQIGNRAIFFPLWLLSGFTIISIGFAIAVLFIVRKRRIETDKNNRTRIPALKLFLIAIFIQIFVWLSENLIGLIKGVRFPWIAYPGWYIALGFLAALIGIAISLRLTPRMNLSNDPYRWHLRAVSYLLVFVLLTGIVNAKIALYPAAALFFLTLAMLVKKPWLKLLFWILSPHFMFRLIFSEGFYFFGRQTAHYSFQPLWMYFALHIFYIVFFALWSFPFLLGFAAVYFDSGVNYLWLKKWKTRFGTAVITAAFILCAAALLFLPSYSDEWRPTIYFDQTVDMTTGKGKLRLISSEYLRDIFIHTPDKDTVITTCDRDIVFKEFEYNGDPWVQINRTMSTSGDSSTIFDLSIKPRFKYQPLSFTITYSSGSNMMEDITGNCITSKSGNSVSLKWNYFPDTALTIPVHFKVIKADSVTETIDARFVELIHPVRVEKEMTNILPQTILRRTEVIRR